MIKNDDFPTSWLTYLKPLNWEEQVALRKNGLRFEGVYSEYLRCRVTPLRNQLFKNDDKALGAPVPEFYLSAEDNASPVEIVPSKHSVVLNRHFYARLDDNEKFALGVTASFAMNSKKSQDYIVTAMSILVGMLVTAVFTGEKLSQSPVASLTSFVALLGATYVIGSKGSRGGLTELDCDKKALNYGVKPNVLKSLAEKGHDSNIPKFSKKLLEKRFKQIDVISSRSL